MSFDSCCVVLAQLVDVRDLRAVKDDDADERRREDDDADQELPLPLLAPLRCLYRQQVYSDHWNLSPGDRSASPSDTIACGAVIAQKRGIDVRRCPTSRNGSMISTGTRARCSIAGQQRRHPRRPARQVDLADARVGMRREEEVDRLLELARHLLRRHLQDARDVRRRVAVGERDLERLGLFARHAEVALDVVGERVAARGHVARERARSRRPVY